MEGRCSRLSHEGLWFSHCSQICPKPGQPGTELVWGTRLEQGLGSANGISAGLGCSSRLSVSELPWQLKLCSWYGTGAGLGALMVKLAWDGRDWLPCGCGCSHQCHCCPWQGAQLVLCHIQLLIDPRPPCRKTTTVLQWHKGGSRRSRQTQLQGCPWPQPVPVSAAAQLCILIPNKTTAGTVDSGEEQPLTWRAAWPGIASAAQCPGQGTSLHHLTPAVARPSIPVTVTSHRAMAPAKTTKLVPFLTQPAPNESEREQPLYLTMC